MTPPFLFKAKRMSDWEAGASDASALGDLT